MGTSSKCLLVGFGCGVGLLGLIEWGAAQERRLPDGPPLAPCIPCYSRSFSANDSNAFIDVPVTVSPAGSKGILTRVTISQTGFDVPDFDVYEGGTLLLQYAGNVRVAAGVQQMALNVSFQNGLTVIRHTAGGNVIFEWTPLD